MGTKFDVDTSGNEDVAGDCGVTGTVVAGGGLELSPTSPGIVNNISKYYQQSTTTFWTGVYGVIPSSNIAYEIVGDTVHLSIGNFLGTGTGGSPALLVATSVLPVQFRPAKNTYFPCLALNAGALVNGWISISTGGTISVGAGISVTVVTLTLTPFNNAPFFSTGLLAGADTVYSFTVT